VLVFYLLIHNKKVQLMQEQITIIGAGVVGAAIALALQKNGHKVLLLDREKPCAGASFGNAGAIVNGSCVPTATTGILFDALKMLSQSNSALSIRPSYLHKISPWLLRFIWQSRTTAVSQNAQNLHALSQHAVQSWRTLTNETPLDKLLNAKGWLKVYQSARSFDNTLNSRKLLDQTDTKYQCLNKAEIHDLEPNLAPSFSHGFFQEDSLNVNDPQQLVQGMVDLFVSRGGHYQEFDVDKIEERNGSVQLKGQKGHLATKKVVIATGAWSRCLAKQLGDDVPLDTERGYHLMLPESTRSLLSRPVVNGDNAFVLSPMSKGMRMTSQIEFAGLNAKPNYNKIRKLLPLAQQMLPKLETREESIWLGHRPSLPDSLPVLGYSTNSNNIVYAFGHQHLGMTLAAITGEIIADLLSNKEPQVPLFPYRANRFSLL
jgi:glycine/D-amino acid oxidase-like deaminating enzyme